MRAVDHKREFAGVDASSGSPSGLTSGLDWMRSILEAAKYRLMCHALSHHWFLKSVFFLLRVLRPVTVVGNVVLVTKARDVREVLERFDDFTLGESIEPGMPWGPFLMTVDGRGQHAAERRMLQSVVDVDADTLAIRQIAAEQCRQCMDGLIATGRIDVVADLAEPVMVAILEKYLGIPPLKGDDRHMAAAMRNLAGIIMVAPAVGSSRWARSRADIADLTCQLLSQIAAGRSLADHQSSGSGADLLTRLLQRYGQSPIPPWFDEDWIRRYLTGLVATGGATIVRGTTHAVDQLLARPEALNRARQLAVALDRANGADAAQAESSRNALRGWIYEALRFRPMLPLLLRHSPRATLIANGTKRARRVPAGAVVLAPPLAAMFDPDAFPHPRRFVGRPIDSYFHFGFGPRHCFGKYIADIVMLEIVRALTVLPNLARAPGPTGRVRYDGPAPFSLVVSFTPPGSRSAP